MVPGMYCPPQTVLVVRDTDPSEVVEGQPALLARPIKLLQVRACSSMCADVLSNVAGLVAGALDAHECHSHI
jgi:hypothetical protein